jgi:hypothetical protein
MLCGGRRKRAANLAVQSSTHPKPTGLIEEIGHLRWQPTKPGAGTDDDRIVGGEILDLGDRCILMELVVRLAHDLLGHQLRHALDVDMRPALTRPFGDCIRHRFDVAVGRVVENQDLRHDVLLDGFVLGVLLCSKARRPLRALTARLP